MFKIGSTDYSNRVVASGYNVNKDKQYESWQDASGTEHRSLTRTQIKGSFDLFFPTLTEYSAFVQNLENNTESDMSVEVTVCDNKSNAEQTIYAFIDYSPTRTKNGMNQDIYEVIRVSITER